MATSIIINDGQDNRLEITSDNDTVDFGIDVNGTRTFKVNAPYDINPALAEEPCNFTSANVNGDIFSGSSITVTEHKNQNVEINIEE